MTLAELLVVVAIVVILIAVMLPRLRPVMESSKLRESARQVNAYFSMAQSLAGERGRPVGVQIERQLGSKGAFLLSLVEVPMPYSGDTINARAEISSGTTARGVTNRFSEGCLTSTLGGSSCTARISQRGRLPLLRP